MITSQDACYKEGTVLRDNSNKAFGRRLTQYEKRIHEHLFSVVDAAAPESLKTIEQRANEIWDVGRKGNYQHPDTREMGELHQDAVGQLWVLVEDGIKVGWLHGQREGLRLGIGLMLKLLTVQDAAGNLEMRAPGAADLLAVLRGMTDDSAADSLILRLMGAKPDTPEGEVTSE